MKKRLRQIYVSTDDILDIRFALLAAKGLLVRADSDNGELFDRLEQLAYKFGKL